MVDGGAIPKLEKGSLFLFSDGPDSTGDLYRHISPVVAGRYCESAGDVGGLEADGRKTSPTGAVRLQTASEA